MIHHHHAKGIYGWRSLDVIFVCLLVFVLCLLNTEQNRRTKNKRKTNIKENKYQFGLGLIKYIEVSLVHVGNLFCTFSSNSYYSLIYTLFLINM